MSGLAWGALAMAATLAYTAWYSRRNDDSERDVNALWFSSGFSLMLAGLLAALSYWSAE